MNVTVLTQNKIQKGQFLLPFFFVCNKISLDEQLNKFMTSPFLEIKDRIFENSVGFVIYDKFPVNKGHCLIIPKREYADYFDSTKEEIEGLNKLLFQTKDFIKKKYNPDGFNVGINSGKDAGQTVFHMHIHLIPRYKNDVTNPRGGVRNVIPGKGDY